MTENDALAHLRKIREEYADRISRAQNPRIGGDWLNPNNIAHYQQRINAIDIAIVNLSLIDTGYYRHIETTNGDN